MSEMSSHESVSSELARMDIHDGSDDDVICDDDGDVICDTPMVTFPNRNPFREISGNTVETEAAPGEVIVETSGFADFGLCEELMTGLRASKIMQPYSTQEKAIKHALEKRDLLCQTPSKSGKTAIFVLSTLEHVKRRMEEKKESASPSVLVVVPTRELAEQIYQEYRRLGMAFGNTIRYLRVVGGLRRDDDQEHLTARGRNMVDIVIGTPGRILDLVNAKLLRLHKVQHFIVDEVQRSLTDADMRGDIQQVFIQTPFEKQVLLFATPLSPEAMGHARKYLKEELSIRSESLRKANTTKHQHRYIHLIEDNKPGGLLDVLPWLTNRFAAFNPPVQFVIFTDTIERTSELTRFLHTYASKEEISELDSSLSQNLRYYHFSRMQQNKCPLLVATDLAARGLNIPDVAVVLNFDRPRTTLDYKDRARVIGQYVEQSLVLTFCRDTNDMDFLKTDPELRRFDVRPFDFTF